MVWGIIAAVASSQLIGATWYSPAFFGKPWMQATFPTRSKEEIGQIASTAYAITLVASAAIALMLDIILMNFFQMKSVVDAIKFAFGLASLTTLVDLPHLAFSQRSLVTYAIDRLNDAVSLVAMAVCIFYLN